MKALIYIWELIYRASLIYIYKRCKAKYKQLLKFWQFYNLITICSLKLFHLTIAYVNHNTPCMDIS